MTNPKDLLDALMKDYRNPEDLIGKIGLLKQLTKQLLKRAVQAEMTERPGYDRLTRYYPKCCPTPLGRA